MIQSSHIVICRYKEDISWINKINNITYTIYNKGKKNIFDTNIVEVPNIGREEYVYLKYIVDNYDILPNRIIFCQGDPFRHCPLFIELINNYIEEFNDIQPLTLGYSVDNPGQKFTNISYPILSIHNIPIHISLYNNELIYYYKPTNGFNYSWPISGTKFDGWPKGNKILKEKFGNLISEPDMSVREIFSKILKIPFRTFNNIEMTPMSHGAIFSVTKERILEYNQDYYKYLLQISENSNNEIKKYRLGFGLLMECCWMELFRYNPPKELYS